MRKVERVTAPADFERDAGKVFQITEMSATAAEKWGMRALLALKGTDGRLPEFIGMGIVGVAWVGLNAFLQSSVDAATLDPLMDEMMACVRIVRDPRKPDVVTDIVSDDDIEEVRTRLWLRSEVLRIHTNFSAADALSKLISTAVARPPA